MAGIDNNMTILTTKTKAPSGDQFVKTFLTELQACKSREIKPNDLFLLMCVREGQYLRRNVTPGYLVAETGFTRKHVHEHLALLMRVGLVRKRGYGQYSTTESVDGLHSNCSQKSDSLPETKDSNCSQKSDSLPETDTPNCHLNDHTSVTFSTTLVSPFRLQLERDTLDPEPVKCPPKRKRKRKREVVPVVTPCDAIASQTVMSKTAKRKPKKDANPDIKVALDFFKAKFHERFGAEYPCDHGKDGSLLGIMLKTCSINDLKRYIERFFTDQDAWLRDKGYAVGNLKGRLVAYVQQEARNTRPQKRPELPVTMTEKQLYGEF